MIVDNFDKQYSVDRKTGCHVWLRGRIPDGYGILTHRGKRHLAHRWAYERAHGKIPAGQLVCHRCDNPPCVNPKHLFLGSHTDNKRDSVTKGRASGGSTPGTTKLTEGEVRLIRRKVLAGATQTSVAKEFDLHPRYVNLIVHRRRWAHVTA